MGCAGWIMVKVTVTPYIALECALCSLRVLFEMAHLCGGGGCICLSICLSTCLPAHSRAPLPLCTPLRRNLSPFIEHSTKDLPKKILVLDQKPRDSWIVTLDIGSLMAPLTTCLASSILAASTCCCWAKAETVLRCSTREINRKFLTFAVSGQAFCACCSVPGLACDAFLQLPYSHRQAPNGSQKVSRACFVCIINCSSCAFSCCFTRSTSG